MNANSMIPARRGRAAETSRVERWEEPQAGTYWRLVKRFKGAHDEEAQMTGNDVAKGTVLMLSSIEMADGHAHVYVFSPHPSVEESYRFPIRVHADVFFDWFHYAPDGEAVRSKELLELQSQMALTQARMMQPPPGAEPIAAIAFQPGSHEEAGTQLATRESITDMERYAASVQANAAELTKWIQSNTAELGEQATTMARFHGERAEASLAKANQTLESVKGLLRTVDNLKLYVGEGTDVMQVTDGEPAAPELPLTIYQEVLALDEETALHLEQGGLDHTHADELGSILSDQSLVDRLIPAPRGVVLVRFRSTDKAIFAGEDLASRFANTAMNAQAQLKHLLVRDGARLWLVMLPEDLQGLKQLMPNAAEMTEHFSTRSGREIKREHLQYAKAQRDQLGSLNAYAKVLIMLWGLYDRRKLTLGWNMPVFTNWLDPQVQSCYLQLCDQSTMIGQDHESYDQYRRRQNQYLGVGATIAVHVRNLFTQSHLPGAFASQSRYNGRSHEYSRIYDWDSAGKSGVLIGRIRNDARGAYVEIPLVKSYSYDSQARKITGKLYVTQDDGDHFLVLDRVHAPDMTYFLTSRSQRQGYANYLLLFQEARRWVEQRDVSETPVRKRLAEAAAAAGLKAEPAHIESAITSALAVARTSRRDKTIPEPGTSAFKTYLTTAHDTLHPLLTDQQARIARVEAWAAVSGRQALRLALAQGRQWRLYLVPIDLEHESLLGTPTHVTVATVDWESDPLQVTAIGRDLLRSRADEQVIQDWEVTQVIPGDPKGWSEYERRDKKVQSGAVAWQSKKPLFDGISYDDAITILNQMRSGQIQPPSPEDAFIAAKAYMDADKSRSVGRMSIGLPIGMLSDRSKERPVVLFAQIDALSYAYHHGDEALRTTVLELIGKRYMRPTSHLAELRSKSSAQWVAAAASLERTKHHLKHGYAKDGVWVMREDSIKPHNSNKALGHHEYHIQALTPLGAELLPWAAKFTAAPL